jgi:hypothetical protein
MSLLRVMMRLAAHIPCERKRRDGPAEDYQDGAWLGRAFTGGIRVEWLGKSPGAPEGPWPLAASAWSIASPFEEISWENRILRVPPLEVQRRIEVARQRPDRAAAIDEYRRTRGSSGA